MAGDTANPRIWVNADVYIGPLGTTAPTDVTTALNAAFLPFGIVSEDSPSESLDNDEALFYGHGGVYIRTIRSKYRRQIKVVPLEDNATVWQARNPGSTASTTTGLTTRVVKTPVPDPQAMVWHLVDGDVIARKVFTKVDLVAIGETTLADTDIAVAELTFDVYTDGSGVSYREITNDPAADVS